MPDLTTPHHFPLMVPGAKPHPEHAEIQAPFDRSVIGTVERTDLAGVEIALENAHRLFRDRDAWLPASERITILDRTADMMRERREELAVESAREGG